MHTRAGCVLALILVVGCAPASSGGGGPSSMRNPAPGGLTVEVREDLYTVRGDTPRELNGALALAAPRHRGRRAYGVTDWVVRWRYDILRQGLTCRVDAPEIRIRLTTRLPHWENREGAAPNVASDWELFLARLRDHEAGHRVLVIREASRALDALRRLGRPTCDGLRRRAEEIMHRLEDRMWEGHRTYDRSTRYGLSRPETPSGR